jgi:hypothetical protein
MFFRTDRLLAASFAVLTFAACDGGDPPTPDAGPDEEDAGARSDAGGQRTPICTEATPPTCIDDSFLALALFPDPSLGEIENTPEGAGFATLVDATAGGATPSEAYVYARFTDDGLVRVDLDDESAFESMDWDIAFQRFVIRLNSGVSGPSCVSGARTAIDTDYDTLQTVPDDLEYRTEEYFTESCEFIPDGSGRESPGTALQSFWRYPGCVAMTGNVYVVRLANGRRLKLTVTSYYDPDVQAQCDADLGIDLTMPTGSGNIRLRWAFLEP